MGSETMTISGSLPVAAEAWAARLRTDGYCIIPGVVAPDEIAALASNLEPSFEQTALSIGPFYGNTTKRFHSLLSRSPFAATFVAIR